MKNKIVFGKVEQPPRWNEPMPVGTHVMNMGILWHPKLSSDEKLVLMLMCDSWFKLNSPYFHALLPDNLRKRQKLRRCLQKLIDLECAELSEDGTKIRALSDYHKYESYYDNRFNFWHGW